MSTVQAINDKERYDKLLRETQNRLITFIKVDVDKANEVAEAEKVSAVPMFKFYWNGAVLETVVGANEAKVKEAVKKYRSGP